MRNLGTPLAVFVAAVTVGGVLTHQSVMAAGFFLSQQSVESAGRGTAGGAAIAGDASTIFTNPAGLTRLKQPEMTLGLSIIAPRTRYKNQGSTSATPGTGGFTVQSPGSNLSNPYEPTPIPNAYFAYPVPGDRVWLGFGVSSPFGIGVRYPKGWFGRYDAIRQQLRTIDLAPTVAVKVNDYLSIGGGVNIQYANAKLVNAVPNPLAAGGPSAATDGRNRLKGDDWSAGFNIGLLVSLSENTRVGVHYRSRMDHRLEGDNNTTGLTGPLAGQNGTVDGSVDLNLPDIVSVAAVHEIMPKLSLLGEFQWFNWSRFREIRAEFDDGRPDAVQRQNYQDSYAAAIGATYDWSDAWTLRGGFRFETTPTRNQYRTTTVPESRNYSLGVGASYAPIDRLRIDFSLFGTIWEDADIKLERDFFADTALESQTIIRARAESHSLTTAIGLRWLF